MRFNLSELETFYWVVRLGSFAKAAAHLNTTPPSVTARVQQLEQDLGAQLIDRSGRERRATARGLEIYEEVQRILTSIDELKTLAGPSGSKRVQLRIGVVELVAMTWLPSIVAHLRVRLPAFQLEVTIDLAHSLIERLKAGGLDVIVAPFRPAAPSFESCSAGFVRYSWFAPCSIGEDVSTIEQLPDWPIARLAGSFPCENMLAKSLSSHVRQRYVICNNFMAMRTMVVSGNCVGVLPDLLLEDAIELKQVRRLADAAVFPDTEMFISWAGTQRSKAVANFVSSLETISTFKRRNVQPALAEVRFG